MLVDNKDAGQFLLFAMQNVSVSYPPISFGKCMVCIYFVQAIHSFQLGHWIKSRINQFIDPEHFLNSLVRMFKANLSHQILLKIVY